jgi:hypothetical protein
VEAIVEFMQLRISRTKVKTFMHDGKAVNAKPVPAQQSRQMSPRVRNKNHIYVYHLATIVWMFSRNATIFIEGTSNTSSTLSVPQRIWAVIASSKYCDQTQV